MQISNFRSVELWPSHVSDVCMNENEWMNELEQREILSKRMMSIFDSIFKANDQNLF